MKLWFFTNGSKVEGRLHFHELRIVEFSFSVNKVREWQSSNPIFLFSLLLSVATRNVLGSVPRNYRSFSSGFLGFHVQQTNRKFHSRQPMRGAWKIHFVRAGLIHSESTSTYVVATAREYCESHFQLKTRLARSSVRSTNARPARVPLT